MTNMRAESGTGTGQLNSTGRDLVLDEYDESFLRFLEGRVAEPAVARKPPVAAPRYGFSSGFLNGIPLRADGGK